MEPHLSEVCPPLMENILSRLKGIRKSSSGWTARCPAHDDRHPSLSISLGKEGQVLLHCHAGCVVDSVVEALGLTMADLFPSPSTWHREHITRQRKISLLDFAKDKQFHWRFLINQGIVEEVGGGLRIPYYQQDGTPAARHRIRHALVAKEGSYWTKGSGEIILYGSERLEEARKTKKLILVEGETDTLTLRFHGYPVLGIPGAEMVRTTLKASYLEGIEHLYVFQEPDPAGERFVAEITASLQAWGWQGKAAIVTLSDVKDPNELHKRDWKAFQQIFQAALDQASVFYERTPSVIVSPTSPSWSAQEGEAPFSLQRLLEAPFADPHWSVPGLLPEGLLLLVGKPKQGKSWFALQTALAVASGGTMFEAYQAHQGEVLYLALEDTPQRLQARSKQLLTSETAIPTGLEFAVQWHRLDEGGLADLDAYVQAHPQARLIVIDTWAKFAPLSPPRARTQYEVDYASLAPLKQLADTHHLSILAIHHLRKAAGKDALDEITGSTGLVGAVDGILLLKRSREQEDATLLVTGRDVQEQTLSLRFDPTTARWTRLDVEGAPDRRKDF